MADAATLKQIQADLASLKGQVATLQADLHVVGGAALAGLEQEPIARAFVAMTEAEGKDPVQALETVSADLGIRTDPDTLEDIASDANRYQQYIHHLQAKLAIANVELANATKQHNQSGVSYWQEVVYELQQQLASVPTQY